MSESKGAFPGRIPLEKPTDRPLSAAMHRVYDMWTPRQDIGNPFYTTFRYSPVTGIGKDESELSVSRRDPSKVLKIGDTYYVWYTRRRTKFMPVGRFNIDRGDDETPVVDWDLADICYATSKDGFDWVEQGIAVPRAPKGSYGDRSLSTPDILVFQGRYYLYYQTFTTMWRANDCVNVSVACSDSPDGPWTRLDRPIIPQGAPGDWDSCAIHDPYPLVYQGKVWLYYKGSPVDKSPGNLQRAQGVAIAEHPEGPFEKSELNPVTNSGHETMLWPYEGGIAALLIQDGPEKDTVQFAPDGLNFVPKAHVQLSPHAPGPFCPDAFADDGDGRGITWGLSHIIPQKPNTNKGLYIVRFDCELSRDGAREEFKRSNLHWHEDSWFQPIVRLPDDWRERILAEQSTVDRPTVGT
ncbi:MAG: family 43 glycosylhydrolase [Chloroflexi bacterium]|nr:family 43 glycosylhydrolase [Chloroflexota bacterium]